MRRFLTIAIGIASVLLAAPLPCAAEGFPSRSMRIVVPYPPGGPTDLVGRTYAQKMQQLWAQPVVVENRAGANGNIGTDAVAKANPDGYTIGMGNFAPLAVNVTLFKSLPFDPKKDVLPVALIERGPLVLMVRNESPFKSVKEIVAAAKARPGKLSYASGGIGGTHHLSGALFENTAGIEMIHAPYKSGSAAATDLMGGQVDMMFEQMYAAMPSIRGGRLRAIAITSAKRSPLLPDLPTMAEAGYPAVEVLNWQGLVGPKGLSADIVRTLNAAGNQALQDAAQRKTMLDQGNEIGGGTPEDFAALIRAERPRWAKVVKDAKIEPE